MIGTRSVAYGAAIWAVIFALPSFYWALGGAVGKGTIAANPDEIPLMNEPMIVFVTGVAKVLGGLLALAIVRDWGTDWVRRRLRLLAAVGGTFMLLYGGALMIQHALMVAGQIDTPDLLGSRATRWHLGLWDPVWILGGLLVAGAARTRTRAAVE